LLAVTATISQQDRSASLDQIVRVFEKFDIGVFECHAKLELDIADKCEPLEWIKPPQLIVTSWEFSETFEEAEMDGIGRDCMRLAMSIKAERCAHRPAPECDVLRLAGARSREMSHSRNASAR
jgi:hypothetical protein